MIEEAHDDLKATSESISADAERLQAIEAQKRTLEPGDERLNTLSAESERLAEEIAAKTKAESELADVVAHGGPEGD